jgi:hypothetical protein
VSPLLVRKNPFLPKLKETAEGPQQTPYERAVRQAVLTTASRRLSPIWGAINKSGFPRREVRAADRENQPADQPGAMFQWRFNIALAELGWNAATVRAAIHNPVALGHELESRGLAVAWAGTDYPQLDALAEALRPLVAAARGHASLDAGDRLDALAKLWQARHGSNFAEVFERLDRLQFFPTASFDRALSTTIRQTLSEMNHLSELAKEHGLGENLTSAALKKGVTVAFPEAGRIRQRLQYARDFRSRPNFARDHGLMALDNLAINAIQQDQALSWSEMQVNRNLIAQVLIAVAQEHHTSISSRDRDDLRNLANDFAKKATGRPSQEWVSAIFEFTEEPGFCDLYESNPQAAAFMVFRTALERQRDRFGVCEPMTLPILRYWWLRGEADVVSYLGLVASTWASQNDSQSRPRSLSDVAGTLAHLVGINAIQIHPRCLAAVEQLDSDRGRASLGITEQNVNDAAELAASGTVGPLLDFLHRLEPELPNQTIRHAAALPTGTRVTTLFETL